jgi:hypothetical protein
VANAIGAPDTSMSPEHSGAIANFTSNAGSVPDRIDVRVAALSHRLDNTSDHRYCFAGDPAHPDPGHEYCEDLSTRDAIDSADSYAQFALQAFNFLP